jgi:hypothetical protein
MNAGIAAFRAGNAPHIMQVFEVGTATITDQQEAQSRLDLTRAQEVAITNDLQVKKALLAQLTGKRVDQLNTLRQGIDVTAPDAAREGEWAQQASQWLPSAEDRAFVSSLMGRVVEPGKFANWIAPPAIGINRQPVDFEYVRFN